MAHAFLDEEGEAIMVLAFNEAGLPNGSRPSRTKKVGQWWSGRFTKLSWLMAHTFLDEEGEAIMVWAFDEAGMPDGPRPSRTEKEPWRMTGLVPSMKNLALKCGSEYGCGFAKACGVCERRLLLPGSQRHPCSLQWSRWCHREGGRSGRCLCVKR